MAQYLFSLQINANCNLLCTFLSSLPIRRPILTGGLFPFPPQTLPSSPRKLLTYKSMALLILGRSLYNKCYHIICGPLCLASFTEHNTFRLIHGAACVRASFLFIAEYYSPVCKCHISFIRSPMRNHLRLFTSCLAPRL